MRQCRETHHRCDIWRLLSFLLSLVIELGLSSLLLFINKGRVQWHSDSDARMGCGNGSSYWRHNCVNSPAHFNETDDRPEVKFDPYPYRTRAKFSFWIFVIDRHALHTKWLSAEALSPPNSFWIVTLVVYIRYYMGSYVSLTHALHNWIFDGGEKKKKWCGNGNVRACLCGTTSCLHFSLLCVRCGCWVDGTVGFRMYMFWVWKFDLICNSDGNTYKRMSMYRWSEQTKASTICSGRFRSLWSTLSRCFDTKVKKYTAT